MHPFHEVHVLHIFKDPFQYPHIYDTVPKNDLFASAIPTTTVYEFLFSQICDVWPQQWIKLGLRPLVPSQKQRRYYTRHEHFIKGTNVTQTKIKKSTQMSVLQLQP